MTDPQQLYGELATAVNRRDWNRARTIAPQLLPMAAQHAGVQFPIGISYLELRDPSHE